MPIGWAVIENEQINLRSVSPTRRAAIVNFLVTDRGRYISNSTSDHEIEAMFSRDRRGATAVEVTIEVAARVDVTEECDGRNR